MSVFSPRDAEVILEDLRALRQEAERQTKLLELILERLASIERTQHT